MEGKRGIKLHPYDTEISVNISPEDEEYYRLCEKLITQVMKIYSSRFAKERSEKEIFYMALIDIALRFVRERVRKDVLDYKDILSKLTSEIEEALK